jgi:arylsulfatase A-like enzyme
MKTLLPLFLTCLVAGCSASAADKPNLIIIMTDDQGYHDVGFNGCEDIPTPHLDSLATNGIRFTDGYVSFPVCGPSRAGLLTGRYQDRFGYTTNSTMDPENPIAGLPLEEDTIAEVLDQVGYTSAIIGKWHMGSHPHFHPLERGFDHFFGFLTGGHDYFPENLTLEDLSEVKTQWAWYRTKLIKDRERVVIDDYLTDELTDAATAFIDRQAPTGTPFFLYLAYNAPHTPMQATEKYLKRFPNIENELRRTYAAMVSSVDDGVGRVLAALREHDLEENTLIVFLSDNGGANNNGSINTPLRGHKSDLFEGGIRVPFAMQWKGTLPAGLTYEEPVISLDILATIAGITDAPIAQSRPLDGKNLIPYLTGEKEGPPHEILFWRKWEQNAMAVRAGDRKLVANGNQDNGAYALFDLDADVSEQRNLYKKNSTEAAELLERWEGWNAQLKDRIFPTLMGDRWWED